MSCPPSGQNEEKMALSDRLKQARESLGLTQKDIAKACSVSIQMWQAYEAGKSVPGGKVLEGIARLGVNINWLLTDAGEIEFSDAYRFESKKNDEEFYNIFSEYIGRVVRKELYDHELRMLGNVSSQIENIIHWLYEFWKNADDSEKTWLYINFEKSFPEYKDWIKRRYLLQEKFEEIPD